MARTLHELADMTADFEKGVFEEVSFITSDGERFSEELDAERYANTVAVLEALAISRITLDEAKELIAAHIRGDIG